MMNQIRTSVPQPALVAQGRQLLWAAWRAMLETRGMVMPVLMHWLIDVVIYAFLALTLAGT
jgi:hypothetical protein